MIQTELNFRGVQETIFEVALDMVKKDKVILTNKDLKESGVQETSRIAYHENKEGKKRQMDRIVSLVRSGKNNLLELARETGLPQSTVAGRCNDALNEGLLKYEGEVVFMGRRRKKIVVTDC